MQKYLVTVLGFFLVFYYPILPILELLWWRKHRRPLHTLSDTINNLALMSLMMVANLLGGGFATAVYAFAYERLRVHTLSPRSAFTWVAGLLVYEFLHYWNHRLGHTVNLLWADHSQHHSSEEMNFSVAGRLPPLGFWWQCWFFLPMAVLGFPTAAYAALVFIAIPYQYWLHTRVITRRLGWLEYVINTPANHRVHHAQNERYLDKNLGASLMLFDHLFGTYERERDDEPCVYGQRQPLGDWNPIMAVVEPYRRLWRDAVQARTWRDKLRLWWMPTGWRPADVAATATPPAPFDVRAFVKHAERVPAGLRRYVVLQAIGYALLFFAGAAAWGALTAVQRAVWVALLIASLYAIGELLNDGRHARHIERARLAGLGIVAAALVASGTSLPLPAPRCAAALAGAAVLSWLALARACARA
jgi:sterol desaturase/sphingolipid hydroxylase (fatty acid hydroxylase superfamily)